MLESGDSYTGRVSVGDLKSGTYTLTLTARSSGGALGEATVDFLIDGTVRTWIMRGLLPAERRTAPGAGGKPRVWVRATDVKVFARWYYRSGPRPAWLDEPSEG